MKNIVSFIFLLVLLVSGCSQEEMLKNGTTSVSGKGRIFTTEFEQNGSRTYVENGQYSRWTEGDFISLFDASTLNLQYLFDGETGDTGGTFFLFSKPEGTGTALSTNYAVYPYSKDVKMTEDGVISVTLPSEQHYAENSYGLGDNTMVAVTEDADDTFLSFKNVGGCLKLQLYGDDVTVKSITLKGNNGEKIAGQATLSVACDMTPNVTMADDADTSITLDCGEEGVKIASSTEEATAFWMVVPPTTFEKGITVIVRDVENKVFTQTTEKQLVIGRNVVKPMAAVKAVMSENTEELIVGIHKDDLNGWDEGLLINKEFFFVTTKDSDGGTLAYFNKLDEDFEDGLLVKYDSDGVITQFYDHEYIHTLNFTDDSLYVTSIPDDKLSTLPIKHMDVAFNYKDYYQLDGMSRGSDEFMDLLSKYYFVYATSTRVSGISNEEAWETLKDVVAEEVIEEILEKGWKHLFGKMTGGIVGSVLNAIDLVELYDEIVVWAYYGNASLNVSGPVLNPTGFVVEFENDNTLPTAAKYGLEKPFQYECGVLLDGVQYIGPIFFKEDKIPELGLYDMPELSEGEHTMTPYIFNNRHNERRLGEPYNFLVYEPEYSVKTISANEEGDDIVFVLDVSWTPVKSNNVLITSQGLSFVNGENETKVCQDLTDNGEDGPIHTQVEGRLSKDYFTWNQSKTSGTAVIRIDYWLKPFDLFGEEYKSPLGYHEIIYDKDKLREALIKLYRSTNGDNWKYNDNWCSDKPITDWYGVDKWGNSYTIGLNFNNLTGKIDQTFPNDVELELKVFYNELESLSVSGSKSLKSLDCGNNQLTSLNVSGCTSLKNLSCDGNQLTSLNARNCISLTSLDVLFQKELSSLDVSGCTALSWLKCGNNNLSRLDVSGCTALKSLYCEENQLTSLDVSGFKDLVTLYCYENQLTSLDVSGCKALTGLDCYKNKLTSLNVSGCTALSSLWCYENQLTSLNVSGCTALTSLGCNHNQLTSLDVSSCTSLDLLDCTSNKINGSIPDSFSQLSCFLYDIKYRYWEEYIPDGKGGYDVVIKYQAKNYGWWYPGEPEKGYHGPN